MTFHLLASNQQLNLPHYNTQTKTIGILATNGTLSSELFHKTTDLYSDGIKVIEQVGEGIVSLVEEGKIY